MKYGANLWLSVFLEIDEDCIGELGVDGIMKESILTAFSKDSYIRFSHVFHEAFRSHGAP
jgi:hypothetical protein